MTVSLRAVVVAACLAGASHVVLAQRAASVVILGSVVDSASALPIPNAEAAVIGTDIVVRSDSLGAFRLSVEPGRYLFRVRRLGFEPRTQAIELAQVDTATMLFVLPEASVSLPTVLVEAREQKYSRQLAGFAERMRTSGVPISNFVTRDEIVERRARLVSDVVRQRTARAQACSQSALLYVDGVQWDFGQRVRARRDPGRSALDEFPVGDIEAMEIYAGASQIPARFNATAPNGRAPGCVIVIWTRGGATS